MKNKDKSTKEALNKLFLHPKKEKSMQPKASEQKRVEKKIRNTGDFLHNIIEGSLDGIVAADDKGYITRANKAFLEMLKHEEDDVVGKHIAEFSIREEGVNELITGDSIVITKEYFDNQKAMIASLLEDGEIRNRKSYFARKDGKIVPCEQNISALYDEEGNINGAVGIIRDITERVRSERNVAEIRDFLDDIFQTAADGIIVTDNNGFIIMINDSLEKITGYNKEDLIGKHTKTLRAEEKEYEEKGIEFAETLLKDDRAIGSDIPWLRKDGSLVYVERSAALLRNKDGEITGAVSTIRDITEKKKAEEELKESKEYLDNLIETSLDCIMVSDKTGYITKVNKYFLDLLGYSAEEVIGKHVMECTPMLGEGTFECTTGEVLKIGSEFVDDANKKVEILLKEGKVTNWETYYFRKDRKIVSIEQNIVCLYNKQGGRNGAVAIIRDITERKIAEKKIVDSKMFLEDIFRTSTDAIVVTDVAGNITMVNDTTQELTGYTRGELLGKHVAFLNSSDQAILTKADKEMTKLKKEGKIYGNETIWERKEGRHIVVESNVSLIKDRNGNVIGGVGFNRDITERKESEIELIKTKDHLNNIIDSSLDSIVLTDNKGYVTRTNKSFLGLLGYIEESQVIGKHMAEFSPIEAGTYESITGESVRIDKESLDSVLITMSKLTKEGKISNLEFYLIRTDRKVISVEENIVNLYNKEDERTGTVGVIRDISERKKFEDALKRSEEKYQNLIENANDAVVSINKEGIIVTLNKKTEEMYNYTREELLGKSVLLLVPPHRREDQKKALEKLKTITKVEGFGRTLETTAFSKDGKEFPVETSMFGSEIHGEYISTSFIRDISERKKMEEKLLQSEKLKSLGELSGGVAHDFNNVLAAILGRVQLLKIQLNPPVEKEGKRKSALELKKGLEIIEKASLDGAETVRRIQEFSKKKASDKDFTITDINELLDDALDFTKVRWKNEAESKGITITIQKEYSPLPPTSGSASELREVFTNLINNAIDAMPQGGRIKIQTLKENGYISITIVDTGVGISEAIKNRIFDPFFTTKGVQSTGLGMSVSYGIINRHGGTIRVDSTEDKGTTFTLMLPISDNVRAKEEEKTKPMLEEKKKSTILVIEDEKEVRNLLADILIESGHHVETASDGSQGIEMFKKNDYALVFTDLGMPGMSGWQVAEKIKNINKNTPVAIITGWNVELKESEMRERGVNLIVNKPFGINQVLNLVQEGMKLRERFEAA